VLNAAADVGPQLLGLPVAVIALGVATLSFIASAFSIGWQIVKHVLDGGRVKVYLNAAVWEPGTALYTNRTGRFVVDDMEVRGPVRRRGTFEVAQLVVENPGRTAVTVYSPGLDARGTGKKKYIIAPRTFATGPGYGPDSSSTESVVRLEPYDRVTFLLDYWSVVPRLRRDAGGARITLRGHVGVAGRTKRPQRSSWRRRWKIKASAYTSLRGEPPVTPYNVLWRQLYLTVGEEAADPRNPRAITRGMVGFVLEEVMSRFEARPDLDVLAQALEEAALERGDNYPQLQYGVFQAYDELDALNGHLTHWTDSLHRRARRSTADET
jgi:hypothetical protein